MRTAFVCVILAAFTLLPLAATAAPTITIYTDADTYQSGDTIEVSLSAENDGEGMAVDLYVGIILPDGDIWSTQYDGWRHLIEPWVPDIYVPAWFEMGTTPFWTFNLPCEVPPVGDAGDYAFAALLTYPGTFTYVSTASLTPFTVNATGSHYYVNGSTGDDSSKGSFGSPWKTIAHALASVEGSEDNPVTIHIVHGTYATSTNGETFPLNMSSHVSLTGDGPSTTTLDAEGSAYHVIYCDGANNLTIENVTITGGNANGSSYPDWSGGGIFCYKSSPTIANSTISNNTTDTGGGGIYCSDSSPIISNNTISGNSADYTGGGICCWGGSPMIENNTVSGNTVSAGDGGGIYCYGSSPTIKNNTITGNRTSGSYTYGGGIYCEGGSPTIKNNTITGNSANLWGGGIYCSNSSPTIENNIITDNSAYCGGGICCENDSPTISNNTITGNSADRGGGIACYWYSSPMIENNTITDNSAYRGGGIFCYENSSPMIENNTITGNSANWFGGGIYCYKCSPSISNNTITGNTADDDGGGIYCYKSSPRIENNTIISNSASWGGGICCEHYSAPVIFDCIIWGNGDDLYDCSATYCCIEGEDAGEGNIHDDPMFVTGPLGKYYLHPDSLCIDAGRISVSAAGLSDRTTQADGTPDTGIVDMGYHYPPLTQLAVGSWQLALTQEAVL
ncbi:MAG TPA: right-handed parallel beta-helix repeat-containing protein [bacterium]|nr:right-handed parallel beta-helix repeat-containing protein [bacterium]